MCSASQLSDIADKIYDTLSSFQFLKNHFIVANNCCVTVTTGMPASKLLKIIEYAGLFVLLLSLFVFALEVLELTKENYNY